MSGRPVLDDLRVQEVRRPGGRRSFTIVWPEGVVHRPAAQFLARFEGSGTQRTYAFLLVDHLRWLEREVLGAEAVTVADLKRYMAAIGARYSGPFGEPWRSRPLGQSALGTAASCLKGFYLHQAERGVNEQLGVALRVSRLPSRVDRERALLGHLSHAMPANPLAPRRVRRRHPKMLPDGARERLLAVAGTARDRMVVTWLADGGYRIGELCGLRARIGDLIGQLDELTTGRIEDNIQTAITANTELKQQIRQLNTTCRQLEDKLAAARSNNRFLDKRIAVLESQLIERNSREPAKILAPRATTPLRTGKTTLHEP